MDAEEGAQAPSRRVRVRVRRRETPRRRRFRVPLLLGGGLLLAVLIAAGLDLTLRYLPALRAVQDGRAALLEARDAIRSGLIHSDPAALSQAQADLERARADFTERSQVLQDGITGRVLTRMPLIGDQGRAARAIRIVGQASAGLGTDVIPFAQRLLGAGGEGVLPRLATVASQQGAALGQLEADVTALDAATAQIPSGWLLGPLDQARSTVKAEVPRIDSALHPAVTILRALPTAVGPGSHRYLMLLTNPGEERPGGGFIGTVGDVVFSDGHLITATFRSSEFANARPGSVPAPRALDAYLFHGVPWQLSDGNWSPDFPTAATDVSRLYAAATGENVDGVIDVDPIALSYVLRALGPVQTPGYAPLITADNVLRELNYIINVARPGDPGKPFEPAFGRHLLDVILHAPAATVPSIAEALARSASEKHAVLFFSNPELEQRVTAASYAGRLPSPIGDSLLVADANLSGSKADLFVIRHYDLSAIVQQTGDVHDHLVLSYANPVVTGAADHNLVRSLGGDYRDYVRVYLPETAELNSLTLSVNGRATSVSPESQDYENHRLAIAFLLTVPHGGSATLSYDYTGPFADITNPQVRYSLAWEKQINALTWPAGVTVTGTDGRRQSWSQTLDTDRSWQVGV